MTLSHLDGKLASRAWAQRAARAPVARCSLMPSSVIREFDYDAADRRLDILFVSGRLYSYHDVPPETALAMRGAFSKGEYFNKHIRDHFRYTRTRRGSGSLSRTTG